MCTYVSVSQTLLPPDPLKTDVVINMFFELIHG
jgi:hypothetical protein